MVVNEINNTFVVINSSLRTKAANNSNFFIEISIFSAQIIPMALIAV